jgi:glycosyltransferase involved in cell wall biosynthesis
MKHLTPTILVSANSVWNIVNFRGGLLRALSARGVHSVVAAPRDRQADAQSGMGTDVRDMPMQRSGLNPLADAILMLRYVALMRSAKPSAFLSFTIKPNIYGALAARLIGVPSIPNVSGLGTAFIRGGLFGRFVERLYRIAFRSAHVIFFQNPDDRDLFLSRRIVAPDKVRLLPGSGIDTERFRPAPPLTARAPTFLFIGRLLADKGVREFVEAAELTRLRHPGTRFQLLGGLDPDNRTAISERDLTRWIGKGAVEYLGPASDVRPFIADADAIVLPSYREGLPRALLEGGAMARPLIAADVPGCREVVEHEVTGLLCEARSSSSLAEAMARFEAMSVDERQALGEAARRKVETEYDERLVIEAYWDVLAPLIGAVPR